MMLTKTQLKRIKKAMNNSTGVDLKISKTQISHVVQEGGSLWSSLFSLGTKALPYATKAVTKVAPALATGALQALGSLGIDKIFGKGQTGGFLIPQNKIDQLIKYKDLLTKSKKNKLYQLFIQVVNSLLSQLKHSLEASLVHCLQVLEYLCY